MSKSRKCFAVPGENNIIDEIRPSNGLSWCYGQTLAEIQARYPGAVEMEIADFCAGKAAKQAAEPRIWTETTEDQYHEMLNVLPPAGWHGGAFLVGEAWDHSASTGKPRFACYKHEGEKYFSLNLPITHKEFCTIFGQCQSTYSE